MQPAYKNNFETHYARASIYYIEGNWEQALQILLNGYARAQGAEKDGMVGVESRFLLGQCYRQLDRWREAEKAYAEFTAANPYEKEAFANLGLVKAKLGDADGAVADFSKALDLDPKFLDARRNRGTDTCARSTTRARSRTSLLYSPMMDAMRGSLCKRAYAYCTSGKRKLGTKHLRAVLGIEPKNDDAKVLLSECTGG